MPEAGAPQSRLPEPEVGSILLAMPDARVWVRTPYTWNSTAGWFGWSWDQLLREYGPENLLPCTVGEPLSAGIAAGQEADSDDVLVSRSILDDILYAEHMGDVVRACRRVTDLVRDPDGDTYSHGWLWPWDPEAVVAEGGS